ncbi:hypothetical protein VTO42DRAFT_8231 [Malbranchea cinnamomea]
MAAKATNILGLLPLTDGYSDLKLVCRRQEFRVHKVVVCTQSPVLAAACERDFRGARTDTVEINEFDALTVKQMIDYLYIKKYAVNLEDYCVDDEAQNPEDNTEPERGSAEENQDKDAGLLSNGNDESPGNAENNNDDNSSNGDNEVTANLLCHIHVNSIADYCIILQLKKLAQKNIQKILQQSWTADEFSSIIKEVVSTTRDKELPEIIASTATAHIATLLELDDFIQLNTVGNFAAATMKKMITEYSAKHAALHDRSKN